MKTKTFELTGAALDWAVAHIEGVKLSRLSGLLWDAPTGCVAVEYTPSTDWSQGGPIIDREDIALGHGNSGEGLERRFSASKIGLHPWSVMAEGPTKLIAAMRCFVASKLGVEVDVPEELL